MGNKISLNVGCCRRGHIFKVKIDTSDGIDENDERNITMATKSTKVNSSDRHNTRKIVVKKESRRQQKSTTAESE